MRSATDRSLIYLDYNASTPLDRRVLEAMTPFFEQDFGNPHSQHALGKVAAAALERARAMVADLIGARARSIVFTSGATESNNTALRAMWASAAGGRQRLVVSATEHKSVLEGAGAIAGAEVVVAPVDQYGVIQLEALKELLAVPTAGVSVLLANNETGVLNPVREVVEVAHSHGAAVHSDTTQAVGKIPVDLTDLGVDFASVSGHKMYGPKGVGALFVRDTRSFTPWLFGGGQERGLRAGTVNVPGVVGLGHAAAVWDPATREKELVQRMWQQLCAHAAPLEWIGGTADRLPNTLNVRFPGADAEAVLANAPRLAISTGSACTSSVPMPSHVLLAMGLANAAAEECIRISVGRPTTEADVNAAAELLIRSVAIVRQLADGPCMQSTSESAISI